MTNFIYSGHKRFVRSVSWSPDGRYIASGGDFGDSTMQVWEAFSGNIKYVHQDQNRIFVAPWSPNGSRIASGSFDATVQVLDALSGNTLLSYRDHRGPVYTVAWLPDSSGLSLLDRMRPSTSGHPSQVKRV